MKGGNVSVHSMEFACIHVPTGSIVTLTRLDRKVEKFRQGYLNAHINIFFLIYSDVYFGETKQLITVTQELQIPAKYILQNTNMETHVCLFFHIAHISSTPTKKVNIIFDIRHLCLAPRRVRQ